MFPPPPVSGVRDDTSLTPVLHPKCWSHLKAGYRRVSVPGLRTGGAQDAAHLVFAPLQISVQLLAMIYTTS